MNKKLTSFLSVMGLVTLQQTVSAYPFLPNAQQVTDQLQRTALPSLPQTGVIEEEWLDHYYVVKSPGLSVTVDFAEQFKTITLKKLSRPIAIIGNDLLSLQWLAHYAAILKAQHAIIWLAQSSGIADVENIKKFAPGLLVLPMSADVLTHYGIYHYPILLRVK